MHIACLIGKVTGGAVQYAYAKLKLLDYPTALSTASGAVTLVTTYAFVWLVVVVIHITKSVRYPHFLRNEVTMI